MENNETITSLEQEQNTVPEGVSIEEQSPSELTPDSIFSQESSVGNFFRANVEEANEPEQSEPQEEQTQKAEKGSNDEVRYQYWQSEADKMKNENEQLKNIIETIRTHETKKTQAPKQEESPQGFPPPPEKPRKPSGFSREEAWSDPSSESARYLDTVDEWRDQMDGYNQLHNEYNLAVVSEERQQMQREREDILRREAEKETYQKNLANITEHLKKEYNASPDEVNNFVQTMDNPESVTIDNLFQLYRMQTGGAVQKSEPVANKEPIVKAESSTNPSDSFDQLKRAQQVPSPMGVLPSSNINVSSSPEETVMDSMISEYKSRNPWN